MKIQSIFLEIRLKNGFRKLSIPLSLGKKILNVFLWLSPLFSLGPFFAFGILFAFPKEFRLRLRALAVIAVYILNWMLFYPVELLHRSSMEMEAMINAFLAQDGISFRLKFGFVIVTFLLLLANYIQSFQRNRKRESVRLVRIQNEFPNTQLRTEMRIRDAKFDTVLLVLVLALVIQYCFFIHHRVFKSTKEFITFSPTL